MHRPKYHLFVCQRHRDPALGKPSCQARGSATILEAFKREIEARNLWETVQLTASQCLGHCEQGPMAVVYPEGTWYQHLSVDDVPKIIEEHLIGGRPFAKKVME